MQDSPVSSILKSEEIVRLKALTGDPAYQILLKVVDAGIARLAESLAEWTSDDVTLTRVNLYRAARHIRALLEQPYTFLEELMV